MTIVGDEGRARAETAEDQRTGRFRLIPGEHELQTLAIDNLRVRLTDRRVLVNGEEKRLFFFPGASTSKAALITDVSVAFVGSRYLPDWLAVVGAGLALYAMFQEWRGNLLALVLGAVATFVWYVVRTDVLELSVEGRPLVVVPTHSTDPEVARSMDAFVDALFALKAGTG